MLIAKRHLSRAGSQGRETGRPVRHAVYQIRVRDQPQERQGAQMPLAAVLWSRMAHCCAAKSTKLSATADKGALSDGAKYLSVFLEKFVLSKMMEV